MDKPMLQPRHKPSFSIAVLLITLGMGGLIATGLASQYFSNQDGRKPLQMLSEATIFSKPRELKPFQLNTAHSSFTSAQLQKHWTLLFFGFTHCSNICPTTLVNLKDIYQQLHPHWPALQVVFVSIDPDEDSPERLKTYVKNFNPHFMGVTGSPEQLNELKKQFGAFSEKTAKGITHSSSVLLINPQGQWVASFPYGMKTEEMRAELEKQRAL
jgi:protein SCO1/2